MKLVVDSVGIRVDGDEVVISDHVVLTVVAQCARRAAHALESWVGDLPSEQRGHVDWLCGVLKDDALCCERTLDGLDAMVARMERVIERGSTRIPLAPRHPEDDVDVETIRDGAARAASKIIGAIRPLQGALGLAADSHRALRLLEQSRG